MDTHFTVGNSVPTCAKFDFKSYFLESNYCEIRGVSSDKPGVLKIIVFCNVTVGSWIDGL
jgi:hypothetical protein